MLNLLRSMIVDGEIRADWRNEIKAENNEEKMKIFRFGDYIHK
jgi:hypothetical protein